MAMEREKLTLWWPTKYHRSPATTAMVMTVGTKMPLTLSASLAMGALEEAASSMRVMIWERVVSLPTRVARISR